MSRRLAWIVSLALFMALAAPVLRNWTAAAGGRSNRPVVGSPAPAFQGPLLEGGSLSLADLTGKPAMLNFFASWCPPCRAEAPDLAAFEKANRDRIRVVGMNLTTTERSESDITAFNREFGIEFSTLLDPSGDIANAYLVRLIPTTYFLDSGGVIRFIVVGPMTRSAMDSFLSQLD